MPSAASIAPARLPGISFEVVSPPPPQVLPRMDIAGFVGFAASGPIGVPVAVEDSTQFAAVFGADVPLAWDPVHDEQAYALLGPAVRSFFRNGGQRCWIVRVADQELAASDTFQIPGLALADNVGNVGAAVLRASSPGSWADGLTVTASLESAPLAVQQFWLDPMAFCASLPPGSALASDDLIRLQFPAQQTTLYATVKSVAAQPQSPSSDVAPAYVTLDRHLWVTPAEPAPGSTIEIAYIGSDGTQQAAFGTVTVDSPPDGLTWISLTDPLSSAPLPGSLVWASDQSGVVLDVARNEATSAGVDAIAGTAWLVGGAPAPPGSPPSAPETLGERLTLSLTVTSVAAGPVTLGGIGFAPGATQFLGDLPTDESLYAAASSHPSPLLANFPLAGPETPVAEPQSPPPDPDGPPPWYIPLGTTMFASPPLGAMHPASMALERDGISAFGSQLFLDPALATEPAYTLLQTASWIRDQSPEPRALQGIHALLDNDEVTLLAVPDAVQRGWSTATVAPAPPPAPPVEVAAPDWSQFLACSTRVLEPPHFELASPPVGPNGGIVDLTWSATDAADATNATYELQQATEPDYGDSSQLYLGPERQFELSPPPAGSNIYVRVRALAGGLESAWSEGVLIDVAGNDRWVLNAPTPSSGEVAYSPIALVEVQIAALRMCAARGDMLALLATPEHYRTPDAIAHVSTLKASGDVAPGSGPDPMFGFGALYHPWLYCSDATDPTTLRRMPPDGSAAGVAARRAAARGAWVAPANEPLQDVLALDQPVVDRDYQVLANARINFVRDDAGGFLWLAADTLSDDPDVRPINVRRLLATLRRTAERYGSAHVFEPNNDVSRRTARRSFQSLLSFMFSAGAFAGATAAEAFQVSTPVTPDDLDQGRLIVELRVAPSQPLAFLTVLLVQTGTGTLQVITR